VLQDRLLLVTMGQRSAVLLRIIKSNLKQRYI